MQFLEYVTNGGKMLRGKLTLITGATKQFFLKLFDEDFQS